MAPRIPSTLLPCPVTSTPFHVHIHQQIRHATLYKRPQRPYTFTQIVQQTDGSTYTQRTTSPLPVLVNTQDTRNTLLWQPSVQSLWNVERDAGGRLASFRAKFGQGFDLEKHKVGIRGAKREKGKKKFLEKRGVGKMEGSNEEGGTLMNLISEGALDPRGEYGEVGEDGVVKAKKGVASSARMINIMRNGKVVKVAAPEQMNAAAMVKEQGKDKAD